jgi:DNA-directed RNA polymerase subunit beta
VLAPEHPLVDRITTDEHRAEVEAFVERARSTSEIDRLAETFPQVAHLLDRPDLDQPVLSRCEVLAATTYLLNLAAGTHGYRLDDQDHFANRRIRSVGELIQNQVRIGLSRMERVVRERMTTQDVEAITPNTLINIRPVVAAIKEFFGTSQLSQFMDQVNPLSGLTLGEVPDTVVPEGWVRVRVRAASLNHHDLWSLSPPLII